MHTKPPQQEKRSAFTLLELLVVLSIIAILASMVLPSLAKARRHAERVRCLANLSQIGKMAWLYSGDNDGFFPETFYALEPVGAVPELFVCGLARTSPARAVNKDSFRSRHCAYNLVAYRKAGNYH
ncbi:MAG: type II secretion system protein [Lentisphaerae bacterium]|jgi:prepilin-type N-terminal cleavage/methylation domain-containing protein|nr:type II secretion system protein [Lentisphaerota bacterium]MBT4823284.1 type II secretion system protein [Lentisphaerota bacterium]MBT5610849.1 type II secretion system protein [Lentisphaerota bacterium]MBT7053719.1 type II secretion system protein [Lentisphaerota bacterium]MBT7841180.1 type II secretion system protein [Lentisphaerota bacterium]